MNNISVLAAETTSKEINGDLSISEGAKPYVQSAQDAAILQKKSKELNSTNLSTTSTLAATASSSVFCRILDVKVFNQIEHYWCAPATVKEVIHFINGSSSSLDTYATKLKTTSHGTDMTVIDDVLNKSQTRNTYIYYAFSTYSEWEDKVQYGMAYTSPPVIDIDSEGNSAWKYKTDGHFMCVSGFDNYNSTNTAYAYVADPHYNYANTYKYKASVVYAVNKAHFRHAIIW